MLVTELVLSVPLAPHAAPMIAASGVNGFATPIRLSALLAVFYGFVEAHDNRPKMKPRTMPTIQDAIATIATLSPFLPIVG